MDLLSTGGKDLGKRNKITGKRQNNRMAGGIFGERPFTLNPKCVLFSLACIALFLIKPSFPGPISAFVSLFVLFWVAYIAMAWYDYYFNCDIVPLRKGTLSLQGKLKPPAYVPEKQNLPVGVSQGKIDEHRDLIVIYLLHILIIVPLIAFIAILGKRAPQSAFWMLGATAAMTLVYHSLGFYTAVSA